MRPSLLFASPFWPQKSGISAYSEVLVNALSLFFDISLLVDNYRIESDKLNQYKIVNYRQGDDLSKFNYIIYNIGNNPDYHKYMYDAILKHPGHVILHDVILYYLTIGYYSEKEKLFSKIYEMEGKKGIDKIKRSIRRNKDFNLLNHKDISVELPLNGEILRNAKSIFVHSEFSKDMLKAMLGYKQVTKIEFVKLDFEVSNEIKKDYIENMYGIPDRAIVFGSIGFIASSKQNEIIALAVQDYNKRHSEKMYYLMIGEGDYINHLLDQYILKTGFLQYNEYYSSIVRCNFIFNLRNPSNGETSATLIECMGMAKPCIVSDIGWFHEVPDNCVIKLSQDIKWQELANLFPQIINSDHSCICENAKKYVETQCNPKTIAGKIYQTLLNFPM